MLGVRQAWRNRGIATALVAHAMKIYASEGIEYAAVGVDAAAPSKTYGLFSTLDFEAIRSSTMFTDRKSTRLNSSHVAISYAVFCLKKKRTRREFTPFMWFDIERSRAYPAPPDRSPT